MVTLAVATISCRQNIDCVVEQQSMNTTVSASRKYVRIIPTSPNWYCYRVIECCEQFLVFGSFDKVIVMTLTRDVVHVMSAHTGRVTAISVCKNVQQVTTDKTTPASSDILQNNGGGITCVSGGEDATVFLWDLQTGVPILSHKAHKSEVFLL